MIRLFALLSALALAGCASDCLKLAQKVCDCQPTANLRDACNSDANTQKAQVSISSKQEALCAQLYNVCDCHVLDTPQGRINCGQARDPSKSPDAYNP